MIVRTIASCQFSLKTYHFPDKIDNQLILIIIILIHKLVLVILEIYKIRYGKQN